MHYGCLSLSLLLSCLPLCAADNRPLFYEKFITNRDNLKLYTIYIPAQKGSKSAPTILWVHGFSKHCRRYLEPMLYMAQKGFNSIAVDIRGHGRSDGPRGHLDNFDDCLKDIQDAYLAYKNSIKNDLFLIGHSMGGLIAIRYAEKFSTDIPFKAVIASSPCLRPHQSILPSYKSTFAQLANYITPSLKISTRVSEDYEPESPAEREFLMPEKLDPFILDNATICGLAQGISACKSALIDAKKINVPFYIIASETDNVVDFSKTKQFYEHIPTQYKKTLTTYTANHALLHEHNRHEIFDKIMDILVQHADSVEYTTLKPFSRARQTIGSWYQSLQTTASSWYNKAAGLFKK